MTIGNPTPDGIIYKLWRDNTLDPRYFKRWKWEKLKAFIILHPDIKTVLEFGSGVSTLLFNSLKLKVTSYETDSLYIDFIQSLKKTSVNYVLWDNNYSTLSGQFDLALVDGIIPREPQLKLAMSHAHYIAIDDYKGEMKNGLSHLTKTLIRIDKPITDLAIFEN